MSGTEQSTGLNAGGDITIGAIASEILGTSANPTVATAILNWEITQGAQWGTAIGVAMALGSLPIEITAALGLAAGYAVGQATGYVTDLINQATTEIQQQANIMGAINLDGQGWAMPDPVSGMGYYP